MHQPSSSPDIPTFADILDRNPGWLDEAVDTKEASCITGVPESTLITMRSRGGGPLFIQPKGTRIVRYFRRYLFEWLLSGGLKSNTSDAGALVNLPQEEIIDV